MKQLTSLPILAGALLLAHGAIASAPDLAWQRSQSDRIREVLFRCLIGKYAAMHPTVIYLALGDGQQDRDPSRRILADFESSNVAVKPISTQPRKRQGPYQGIGPHFARLDQIGWLSRGRVEVTGRYSCGIKCGSSATYIIAYQNGDWTVTGHKGGIVCN